MQTTNHSTQFVSATVITLEQWEQRNQRLMSLAEQVDFDRPYSFKLLGMILKHKANRPRLA
jgi:hypothetical protein